MYSDHAAEWSTHGSVYKSRWNRNFLFLSPRDDMDPSKTLNWKPRVSICDPPAISYCNFPKMPTIYCASSNLKVKSDEVGIFFNSSIGQASASYLQSSISCSLVWTMKSQRFTLEGAHQMSPYGISSTNMVWKLEATSNHGCLVMKLFTQHCEVKTKHKAQRRLEHPGSNPRLRQWLKCRICDNHNFKHSIKSSWSNQSTLSRWRSGRSQGTLAA